jgi:hypothetical protein
MSREIYGAQVSAHDRKLVELKRSCDLAIENGVDVETTQELEHFALTPEDQINLQNLSFQLAAGAGAVLYHADGQLCRPFTAAEIGTVTEAAVRHVPYHTTYFNHLKAWVVRTKAEDALQEIYYGADLPEDLAQHMGALLGGGGE